MEVTPRAGESREDDRGDAGARFTRDLSTFEGWSAKLASELRDYPPPGRFVDRAPAGRVAGVVRAGGDRRAARALGERLRARGGPRDPRRTRSAIRVIESATSAAHHVDVPSDVFEFSTPTCGCAAPTRSSSRSVGAPPFTITVGKKTRHVETFEELRAALARARQGGHPGEPLQGPRRDEPERALGDDDGSGPPHRSCASTWRTRRWPTGSSRCSWATRSSRGASSSSRTRATCRLPAMSRGDAMADGRDGASGARPRSSRASSSRRCARASSTTR